MRPYAAKTDVSIERTRAEIEHLIRRYGATGFGYAWLGGQATIFFQMEGHTVRLYLPMPDPDDPEFTHTPSKLLRRSDEARESCYTQACRARWRALSLVLKAKLEAMQTGITTFEDEFLAGIVLPNQQTVGAWAKPQLQAALDAGKMPALMPGCEQ